MIFFPFNMPWRYTICIAWFLYTCRDDLTENLGKTTAQECKKVHFRLSCVVQKRLCLNSLKWHQKSVIVLTGRKLGFNNRFRKGGHKIYFRPTTIFSFKISLSYYWPTKRETWTKLTLINIKIGRLSNSDSNGNENVKIIITTTTNYRFDTQINNFARASHFLAHFFIVAAWLRGETS